VNGEDAGDVSSSVAESPNDTARLLDVRGERGKLVVGKHVWSNTRKEFRQIFGQIASDVVMFQLWRVYGGAMVKELFPRRGIDDDDSDRLETLRAILLGLAETNGWGNATAELKEATNEISLDLADCTFCEKSTSDKPVCFEMSGLLAGFSENISGKKVSVSEIRCIAKGDKTCSFTIRFMT
jgi:predicted hydrocarbon binding protein